MGRSKIYFIIVLLFAFIVGKSYSYDIINPPVHQYIAKEALDVWKDIPSEVRNYAKSSTDSRLDDICKAHFGESDDIIIGSGEEDQEWNPLECWGIISGEACETNEGRNGFFEHYWDPDYPNQGGYNCDSLDQGNYNQGLIIDLTPLIPNPQNGHYDSAYRVAQDYWDNKVIPFYYSGKKQEAYYWLGRIAHLLADMTVPAHVHLVPHDPYNLIGGPDTFEDFFKGHTERINKYKGKTLRGQEYRFEGLPNLSNFDWQDVHPNPSNLFKLFWYTAQKTQYFASKTERLSAVGNSWFVKLNGHPSQFDPSLWEGEATPIPVPSDVAGHLQETADALIPHAMKAVAGLYRVFWFEIQNNQPVANLTPYQPSGWSDNIVVSNLKNTNTDTSPLYTTDTLYVDWAVINDGPVATPRGFSVALYVDGVLKKTWSLNKPLNSNDYWLIKDYSIGKLSEGAHTLKIVADSTGVISESDEADNEYIKTITVISAPVNYKLSLSKTGNGSVKANGISHSLPWSGKFASGTQVQLEAIPNTGWTFTGWGGDLMGTINPTFVTMSGNLNVTANFSKISQTGTLSVTTTPVNGAIYVDDSHKGTGSWSGTLNVGSHKVSFGDVSGYTTPATKTVTVTAGQTTSVTGTYIIIKTVSFVTVTPSSWTFNSSDTKQLTATATYTDNSTEDVTTKATWTSSNSNVATVSNSGLVTSGQNGSAIITGTYGGKSDKCNITVNIITTNPIVGTWKDVQDNYRFPPWDTITLSSDGKIEGTEVPLSPGLVRIYDGTYTFDNTYITFYFTSGTICYLGTCTTSPAFESDTLKVQISGNTMIWTSSYGLTVTFVKASKTLIDVSVSPSSWTFTSAGTTQLTATATYTDNSTEDVTAKATWTSSNSNVAAVSNSGLVTSGQNASAVITATYGGRSGTCNVIVNISPSHITDDPFLKAAVTINDMAEGLTFDNLNNLYISTVGGEIFKLDGKELSTFIAEKVGGLDFNRHIRFSQGNFYINNIRNVGTGLEYIDEVLFFDGSGKFVRKLLDEIDIGGNFFEDIAVNDQGQLYVAADATTSDYIVVRIDSNGQNRTNLIKSGDGGVFVPVSLAIDKQGNLYIGTPSVVSKFNTNGSFLKKIVQEGVNGFEFASNLAIDHNNNLYVGNVILGTGSSPSRWNVLRFDSNGNFWGEFIKAGAAGLSAFPDDMGFDLQGRLYIADDLGINGIVRFDQLGNIDRIGVKNFQHSSSSLIDSSEKLERIEEIERDYRELKLKDKKLMEEFVERPLSAE